jgi:hypothetical protein
MTRAAGAAMTALMSRLGAGFMVALTAENAEYAEHMVFSAFSQRALRFQFYGWPAVVWTRCVRARETISFTSRISVGT